MSSSKDTLATWDRHLRMGHTRDPRQGTLLSAWRAELDERSSVFALGFSEFPRPMKELFFFRDRDSFVTCLEIFC